MAHKISSAANPLIKTLKSLHAKKGRAETGLFLAEGARLARRSGRPRRVAGNHGCVAGRAGARRKCARWSTQAEARRVRCDRDIESVLAADLQARQSADGDRRLQAAPDACSRRFEGDTIVALEGVRDPGNLGTILRTADSTGAGGVILIGESCDPFSVEAVRASMGSLFAMKLARASFEELLRFKRAARREPDRRFAQGRGARRRCARAGARDRAHGQRAIRPAAGDGGGVRCAGALPMRGPRRQS